VHERDIKAQPSVTKSLPHQAPFAPQEELPQKAAVLLRPAKCPALQPCARRHHLIPEDIGAATAAMPLRLGAWQNPALQPCVRRRHVMLGDIGNAAAAAPLRLGAWQNLALQPCVRRRHVMPGDIGAAAAAAPLRLDSWQNPGTAAMCAPPPLHAQGHRGPPCSRARAAAMSRPETLALQPPLRCCILMPSKTPGAAAMCVPPPRHARGHLCCSRCCDTAS
jgi:hypothetical protein